MSEIEVRKVEKSNGNSFDSITTFLIQEAMKKNHKHVISINVAILLSNFVHNFASLYNFFLSSVRRQRTLCDGPIRSPSYSRNPKA